MRSKNQLRRLEKTNAHFANPSFDFMISTTSSNFHNRMQSTTDPSFSTMVESKSKSDPNLKKQYSMRDDTWLSLRSQRRLKFKTSDSDLLSIRNLTPQTDFSHNDSSDKSIRDDLLSNKFESVDQIIQKERSKIYKKQINHIRQITDQIKEAESPSEQSPAFPNMILQNMGATDSPTKIATSPYLIKTEKPKFTPISKSKTPLSNKLSLASESLTNLSQQDFYECVRKFDDINKLQEFHDQRENVYVRLIKQNLIENKMPKAYPLLFRPSQGALNISRVGEQGLKNAIESLQTPQMAQITKIDLSQNKITAAYMQKILINTNLPLQALNLSNCQLDGLAIMTLTNNMKQLYQLQQLNLEGNRMGDAQVTKLLKGITAESLLKELNLSKNNLSSVGCKEIAALLKRNSKIRELYLAYNNINQVGGNLIFKVFAKSKQIRVLDFSYNQLGNKNNFYELSHKNLLSVFDKRQIVELSECVQSLIRYLQRPSDLVHLDLSYNKFDTQETLEIQKAVLSNQNIYGFHFEGNHEDFIVDSMGFIESYRQTKKTPIQRAKPNAQRYEALRLLKPSIRFPEKHPTRQLALPAPKSAVMFTMKHHKIKGVSRIEDGMFDVCWVCLGWQEMCFEWTPHKSGYLSAPPIFLHLDIFQYRPIPMTQVYGKYVVYVMVPPDTQLQYFFTNPVEVAQEIAEDQPQVDIPNGHFLSTQQVVLYNEEIIVDTNPMKQVNQIQSPSGQPLFDINYNPQVRSKPRENKSKFDFSIYMGRVAKGWSVETSYFGNYKGDTDAHIEGCFQFDFESSKIGKMSKNEAQDVKDTIRKYYPLIFNCYKYYASFGSITNIPCINPSAFYDLINQTTIMDQRLRNTDVDVMFLSSNGKDQNYPQTFERAIVRYQLMELFVRIAIDKYLKSGAVKTTSFAIVRLFEEDGLKNHLQTFEPSQLFRNEKYWNEENEKFLVQSLPFIRVLFKYTTQLSLKKGNKTNWISSSDLRELIISVSDNLTDREIYHIFLLSMMTQVDELNQPRHYQMSLIEFLEALARVADKLSLLLPLPNEKVESILQMPQADRANYDFNRKFRAFCLYLYFRLIETIRETFKGQADDDYYKMDQCMMSEKEYRKFLMVGQNSNNEPKSSIIPISVGTRSRNSSFDSEVSESESDRSVELHMKEFILVQQLKETQKVQIRFKFKGQKNCSISNDINQIESKGVGIVESIAFGKECSECFQFMIISQYLLLKII